MLKLSKKEVRILWFIRNSRHKTTIAEIALGVGYSPAEVEVFVEGMVGKKLLNLAAGSSPTENAYYTNPEKREEIFDLIG
jgi:hypothetical protein